jgi:hypothetical protein
LRRLAKTDPESLPKAIRQTLRNGEDDDELWRLSVNLLVTAYGQAQKRLRDSEPPLIRRNPSTKTDWTKVATESKSTLESMGMAMEDFLDSDGTVLEERLEEVTETSTGAIEDLMGTAKR